MLLVRLLILVAAVLAAPRKEETNRDTFDSDQARVLQRQYKDRIFFIEELLPNNKQAKEYVPSGQNEPQPQNIGTQTNNQIPDNSFNLNIYGNDEENQRGGQISQPQGNPTPAFDTGKQTNQIPYGNNSTPLYFRQPARTWPVLKPDEIEHVESDPVVTYDGAQVWNVDINSETKLRVVGELSRNQDLASWGGDHDSADFMIKPDKLHKVGSVLNSAGIRYNIVIDDLQRVIDTENPQLSEEELELQNRKGHRMTWKQYHRLSDIHGYLDYLAETYPTLCKVMSIGKSNQGRDLKMIHISNGNPSNKVVVIDGGIHAREWISPATVTYFINEIVENYESESSTFRNLDWYIIPVLNPDGYEFTHTNDRLWRKNRKGYAVCNGIDLNRNFGYKWGGKGTSKNPCSEIYAGTNAFSESESTALQDFITRIQNNSGGKVKLYATYHSYGEYILYPWGYDNAVPQDYEDLDRVAKAAAQAIVKAGGNQYKVGASSIVLYPAAGGSDDWAKAVPRIKYTYTIELSDKGQYGFVLPASYIPKVAKESLAALRVMADAAIQA